MTGREAYRDAGRLMQALVAAAVAAYAAVFAAIGVDTMVRVWTVRAAFDTMFDVGVLLLYEGMRVITILTGVALAAAVLARSGRSRYATGVALLVGLLLVGYAKATAYSAFPGFVQERIARSLLGAGWSPAVLVFVFGQPVWAFMLAAAAILRLAVTYPADATPERVLSAGAADRSGMLRGVALAGVDVGALARRACATALRRGLVRPLPVWCMAVTAAVAQHFAGPSVWPVLVTAATAVPVGLAVPALRAALVDADALERARVLWFVEAALVAAFAIVIGGILSAVPGGLLSGASFALLAVAPMIVLLCAATALAPAGSVEAERAIQVTGHWCGTVVLVAAAATATDALLLEAFGAGVAVRSLLAVAVAAGLATPVHAVLRVPATKLASAPLRTQAADR